MAAVRQWTGHEAAALRRALRLTVRGFAEHLGVAVRTVTKWESLGAATTPYPESQRILDTALMRADTQAMLRFEQELTSDHVPVQARYRRGPREWDYETWTDDLSRAAACIGRQDYRFAASLVERWMRRFTPDTLDDHGLLLHARSLVLLGDVRRDQGEIRGPLSARPTYHQAHQLFRALDVPRRTAQVELALAVVDEMAGHVRSAAHLYDALAQDQRLSPRDQARAQLWVGTALSKSGDYSHAIRLMRQATERFEQLDEPDDWAVAHQKIALAFRGEGNLTDALRYIDVALSHRSSDSPMQNVRLNTAHAHILLSDRATSDSGLLLLDQAATVARQYGMAHQQVSIDSIRYAYQNAN